MSAPGGATVATGDPAHPRVPAAERADAHWYPPAGLTHRGTVVLLPGRGEHPGVYERFGRRLAADAYVVHVLDTPTGRTADETAASVDAIAREAAVPLVLAGSDTGALHALAAAIRTASAPDALLLAGIPQDAEPGAWDDEWEARTTCPTHRGRLDADPLFVSGALAAPVPPELRGAAEAALADLAARPGPPVLVLHGASDPVSPPDAARTLAARLPRGTLATVADGRHDVLNDIQHRSVAAVVVQWLERLRRDPALTPILTVEHDPLAG